MKKKTIKKLIQAIAVAGGILAGSVNSYAQTDTRPADGAVSSDGKATTTPAPTTPPPTRDGGAGGSPGVVPAPGTVEPMPMPRPIVRPPAGDAVTPPPAGTPREVPPPGTRPTTPTTGNVTLIGRPVSRPLPPGTVTILPVPTGVTAANSGVQVFAGDIVRATPGESTPTTLPAATTPVLTLVRDFDAQRTQELAARATVLDQLRAASPEQRTALIAEMQATGQQQAVEQREAARELRNEIRALREERKGR